MNIYLFRFLRQRIVLAFIFSFSLLYFLIKSGILDISDVISHDDSSLETLKLRMPKGIKWQTDQITAAPLVTTCRNTKQGSQWITDEKGYICQRSILLQNGCCPEDISNRFSCETCQNTIHCCASYEICVSCCLKPDRKTLLENVIKETTGSKLRALLNIKDQFELCQIKCRTSSSSVLENKYKNSRLKYCYGHEPKLPYEAR